jgi:hypothetical protein
MIVARKRTASSSSIATRLPSLG